MNPMVNNTRMAEELLPNEAGCLAFVNADLIAAGLAPFEPERAAGVRVFLLKPP